MASRSNFMLQDFFYFFFFNFHGPLAITLRTTRGRRPLVENHWGTWSDFSMTWLVTCLTWTIAWLAWDLKVKSWQCLVTCTHDLLPTSAWFWPSQFNHVSLYLIHWCFFCFFEELIAEKCAMCFLFTIQCVYNSNALCTVFSFFVLPPHTMRTNI